MISYYVFPGLRDVYINPNPPTVDEVVTAVCDELHLEYWQLWRKRRIKEIVRGRYICFRMLYKLSGMTLEAIGAQFNNMDHTTVIHGLKSIQDQIDTEPTTKELVKRIKEAIETRPIKCP